MGGGQTAYTRQRPKYAHIGMEDTAEALAALPFPLAPAVVEALEHDSKLQAVVTAWPRLHAETRSQILAFAVTIPAGA